MMGHNDTRRYTGEEPIRACVGCGRDTNHWLRLCEDCRKPSRREAPVNLYRLHDDEITADVHRVLDDMIGL